MPSFVCETVTKESRYVLCFFTELIAPQSVITQLFAAPFYFLQQRKSYLKSTYTISSSTSYHHHNLCCWATSQGLIRNHLLPTL